MTDKLRKLLEVIDPNSIILSRNYEALEQTVVQLEAISGYSLDELKRLFASGYTMSPPGPALTMADLEKEMMRKWSPEPWPFLKEKCECRTRNPEPWERHMVQRFMKAD